MPRAQLTPQIREAIGHLAEMAGVEITTLVVYVKTNDGETELDVVAEHPQVVANTLVVSAAALIAGENPQDFPQTTG